MKDFDIEERINRAEANFESGYNCAQSVFLAYADLFDLDDELAKKMSVSFGGGIGRMREVCGTVSAMSMLAGFHHPVHEVNDLEQRAVNYGKVQQMACEFKDKFGSIICRDLLPPEDASGTAPKPSERTSAYYQKRPCSKYVCEAAKIAGNMLKNKSE